MKHEINNLKEFYRKAKWFAYYHDIELMTGGLLLLVASFIIYGSHYGFY